MSRTDRLRLLAGLLMLSCCAQVMAHATLPSKWEATELADDQVRFSWITPATLPAGVTPPQPRPLAGCGAPADYHPARVGAMIEETWRQRCDGGLRGRELVIEGMALPGQQVLARISHRDGQREQALLDYRHPTHRLGGQDREATAVPAYFGLGVEHILTGWDHLAFITVLVLAGWKPRRPPSSGWVLTRVTSFTVGHSLTLALAALGWISVWSRAVEVGIAASILGVAWMAWRHHRDPGPEPARPLIGLVFGLLHGLGFAGSLAEIGLPVHDQLPALLWFNLGIEAGQVLFIAAVLAPACLLLDRLPQRRAWRSPLLLLIALLASYWFWSRLLEN